MSDEANLVQAYKALEEVVRDAARYRFIRRKAVLEHSLEAFVALGQADFISGETQFDKWIDKARAADQAESR